MGVNEQVIIDCGPLIDSAESPSPTVNWYLNGVDLSLVSRQNVVISRDGRFCTIITSSVVSDLTGNSENYTCEVCSDLNTCISRTTTAEFCG